MRVQYHDPPKADMINAEWRSPLCDEQGRLVTVGGGAGGASTVDQGAAGTEDWKVEEANSADIANFTQVGAGWFPRKFKKVLLADMTGSGIDLTALTPAGMKVVGVMGSRTTVNGNSIYLEAVDNDPGVEIDLDFGRNYIQYGQWKKIGTSTTNGCFPLWIIFA